MADPYTPVIPPPLSKAYDTSMKALYYTYKSLLPHSDRIYYWLQSKRHSSKICNKLYNIWKEKQLTAHSVQVNTNLDEYNSIVELGGLVLTKVNKDGSTTLIPINRITFDIDGYETVHVENGITIKGDLGLKATQKETNEFFTDAIKQSKTPNVEVGYDLTPDMISKNNIQMKKTIFGDLAIHDSTNSAQKESQSNELSPEIKAAIEKQRKEGVDTAVSKMAIVDTILKEAKSINDEVRNKYPLDTNASVDIVHEDVFSDISISSDTSEIVSKRDELPQNWEYPSTNTDIQIHKPNTLIQEDIVSPIVNIESSTTTESNKLYRLIDGVYIEVNNNESSEHK